MKSVTCSRKFRKVSIYCSLDKENFLNEIMKVSHVSFNLLMSDNLTDRQETNSQFQPPPPPPPLWF